MGLIRLTTGLSGGRFVVLEYFEGAFGLMREADGGWVLDRTGLLGLAQAGLTGLGALGYLILHCTADLSGRPSAEPALARC